MKAANQPLPILPENMKLSRIALIAVPAALIIGLIAKRNHCGPCGYRSRRFGGPGFGGPGRGIFLRLKALRHDLDLGFGQKIQIHTIVRGYKDSLKTQWAAGKSARDSLRQANLEHGPDSPEVQAAATHLAEIFRGRVLLFAKIANDIRPVLSDEQIRKFEAARLDFESFIQTKLDNLH